uniref:hypothetical protein n=1 Tax=Pantoea sp. IMH TaxID=1267600 RepID=UPI000469EA61|nr:hypothetical protein [Pantoea sp. IMH]
MKTSTEATIGKKANVYHTTLNSCIILKANDYPAFSRALSTPFSDKFVKTGYADQASGGKCQQSKLYAASALSMTGFSYDVRGRTLT